MVQGEEILTPRQLWSPSRMLNAVYTGFTWALQKPLRLYSGSLSFIVWDPRVALLVVSRKLESISHDVK